VPDTLAARRHAKGLQHDYPSLHWILEVRACFLYSLKRTTFLLSGLCQRFSFVYLSWCFGFFSSFRLSFLGLATCYVWFKVESVPGHVTLLSFLGGGH
jgi:hypothetical protein